VKEDLVEASTWLRNRLTLEDLASIIRHKNSFLSQSDKLILRPRITLQDLECLEEGVMPPV